MSDDHENRTINENETAGQPDQQATSQSDQQATSQPEVRYYSFQNGQQAVFQGAATQSFAGNGQQGFFRRHKPIVIFLAILMGFLVLGYGCTSLMGDTDSSDYTDISGNHIGVLYIEGTISDSTSSSLTDTAVYDHQWTMEALDSAIENSDNKGLILFVNTPGGGVYESDELYLKLKEYKATGKPLYVAMGSMATSGGYYISAPADKIYANRNCWTGSIGVTIGTIYDVSGLLKRHGVKSVTIDSGKNKSMGSIAEPLTKEQQEIYQGLVDESYDQFVDIVAQGRNMPEAKVRKLADGRIYTAKQAKENGLIDEIGTLENVEQDMQKHYKLEDCEIVDMQYIPETSIFDSFFMEISKIKSGTAGDVSALLEMMNKQGEFPISYMSEIQKGM